MHGDAKKTNSGPTCRFTRWRGPMMSRLASRRRDTSTRALVALCPLTPSAPHCDPNRTCFLVVARETTSVSPVKDNYPTKTTSLLEAVSVRERRCVRVAGRGGSQAPVWAWQRLSVERASRQVPSQNPSGAWATEPYGPFRSCSGTCCVKGAISSRNAASFRRRFSRPLFSVAHPPSPLRNPPHRCPSCPVHFPLTMAVFVMMGLGRVRGAGHGWT